MSKANLDNAIRNNILANIREMLEQKYDTPPLDTSASEVTIPVVDEEGNEKWAVIKVTIPRGARNGQGGFTEFDGYAAAEDWRLVVADREDKEKKRQEKRTRAEAEKERKRAARATVKTMKKEIEEILPSTVKENRPVE